MSKTFEEYEDGEVVVHLHRYMLEHTYTAYKSKYTHNAFRIKNSYRELIVDISEITPLAEVPNEKLDSNIQSDLGSTIADIPYEYCRCLGTEDGTYQVQD